MASSGRGKTPEPWLMPERAKSCGEHSEGIFLPTSKNLSQLEFELTTLWERRYRTGLANSAAQPFAIFEETHTPESAMCYLRKVEIE